MSHGFFLIPSFERGCQGKTILGRDYVKSADKMAKKYGKQYLVYRCPHCGNNHLTTKIEKRQTYLTETLYVTAKP